MPTPDRPDPTEQEISQARKRASAWEQYRSLGQVVSKSDEVKDCLVLAAALRAREQECAALKQELADYRVIYPRDVAYWKGLYEEATEKERLAYDMLGVHVHNALKTRAEKAESENAALKRELDQAKLDPQERIMVNMTLEAREKTIAGLRSLLAQAVEAMSGLKQTLDDARFGESTDWPDYAEKALAAAQQDLAGEEEERRLMADEIAKARACKSGVPIYPASVVGPEGYEKRDPEMEAWNEKVTAWFNASVALDRFRQAKETQ